MRLSWLSTPKATLKAWRAAGDMAWRTLLNTRSTGLPGIKRGMKKLTVMAIQAVTT
jgi:hypothetical protein